MKMSYHSGANRKKKKGVILFLVAVLVLFFYSAITGLFYKAIKVVAYPVWISKNKLEENTINPLGFAIPKKDLLVENEQLKKDLAEAEVLIDDRDYLIKENLELKEILGREVNEEMVLASVLVKPNISVYDTLVLDLGEKAGVKVGDKVYAYGSVLIGSISEIYEDSSLVKLYSTYGEELNVVVGLYNINVTATGAGAGNFEVKMPRDIDVVEGDPVFVPDIKSSTIGYVEKIESHPTDAFKIVYFKSSVNLFELRWVQVLKTE